MLRCRRAHPNRDARAAPLGVSINWLRLRVVLRWRPLACCLLCAYAVDVQSLRFTPSGVARARPSSQRSAASARSTPSRASTHALHSWLGSWRWGLPQHRGGVAPSGLTLWMLSTVRRLLLRAAGTDDAITGVAHPAQGTYIFFKGTDNPRQGWLAVCADPHSNFEPSDIPEEKKLIAFYMVEADVVPALSMCLPKRTHPRTPPLPSRPTAPPPPPFALCPPPPPKTPKPRLNKQIYYQNGT